MKSLRVLEPTGKSKLPGRGKNLQMVWICRPVYGLIFLFKWRSEKDDRAPQEHGEYHGKVFFAKQVINNACATQAILSVLLNKPELTLGPELTSLRDFTADFSSEMRGQ